MTLTNLSLEPTPDFYFKNMCHFAINQLPDYVGTITAKSDKDFVASCYPMKGIGRYYGHFTSYEAAISFIKEGIKTYFDEQLKLKL